MSNGMGINGMIVGKVGRNRDAGASFFVYDYAKGFSNLSKQILSFFELLNLRYRQKK